MLSDPFSACRVLFAPLFRFPLLFDSELRDRGVLSSNAELLPLAIGARSFGATAFVIARRQAGRVRAVAFGKSAHRALLRQATTLSFLLQNIRD